jgi:hypothetical protein
LYQLADQAKCWVWGSYWLLNFKNNQGTEYNEYCA